MKKLLLTLSLVVCAVAVQAGEAKTTKTAVKEKTACCSEAKGTEQTKACTDSKAACCNMKNTKQALLSPKAAGEVTKKL